MCLQAASYSQASQTRSPKLRYQHTRCVRRQPGALPYESRRILRRSATKPKREHESALLRASVSTSSSGRAKAALTFANCAGIMQDYGAIDTPAATAPKRIGRKTIVALVATLGLAAGVAALSLTPSKKTADVASLYDATEPHPLYCPWEPNSIVCVLGCGALCQLGPRQCTRVKCCSKETCRNPPPLLLPPTPAVPKNPDDIECPNGGCASPVSYFYVDGTHRSVHRRPEQYCHDGIGHVLGRGLHSDGHRRGRFDQLRRRRLPPDRVHRQTRHLLPGRPVREVWRRGYDRAAAGVLLPAGPASDSRPQLCVEIKILRGPTHGLICAQVPKARCAKGINGLTDCTDLCQKFPNAPHTTTCCKCYPAC